MHVLLNARSIKNKNYANYLSSKSKSFYQSFILYLYNQQPAAIIYMILVLNSTRHT